MFKTTNIIFRLSSKYLLQNAKYNMQKRLVSALYISGDKASEQYVTIQPFTDFEVTFSNIESLEMSIRNRKMPIDLKQVTKMYAEYCKAFKEIKFIDDEREMIAKKLKDIKNDRSIDDNLIKQLKEKGKQLKIDYKAKKMHFKPLKDEFMQLYLHLPNLLHPNCPHGDYERILFRSRLQVERDAKSHLSCKDLIEFTDNSRYYMKDRAAEFDIFATDALTSYIRNRGNFIQTSNPDFVRCVLLEANASPVENYHKVLETHLENSVNAAYLTGGASFESYLGAVTKLCVFPSVIPLKYVCSGRLYEKTLQNDTMPSLYTATQTNAVQTFVASLNQKDAEEEMDAILNMCVDFYKLFPNLHFRIIYVPASELTPSETLRAQIEVYSPKEKRYITVGKVSNYNDFVSKRILFAIREGKKYIFPHLVGGPVLYTSRLIAALIESEEKLDYEKLLKFSDAKISQGRVDGDSENSTKNAIEEFKSLFK